MTTDAGVTFDVLAPATAAPAWVHEPNITISHIPYSDSDDIQAGGLGSSRVTLTAHVTDDDGIPALQAAVGVTRRTLTDYLGDDWPNVLLVAVRNPRRYWQGSWLAELELLQAPEDAS